MPTVLTCTTSQIIKWQVGTLFLGWNSWVSTFNEVTIIDDDRAMMNHRLGCSHAYKKLYAKNFQSYTYHYLKQSYWTRIHRMTVGLEQQTANHRWPLGWPWWIITEGLKTITAEISRIDHGSCNSVALITKLPLRILFRCIFWLNGFQRRKKNHKNPALHELIVKIWWLIPILKDPCLHILNAEKIKGKPLAIQSKLKKKHGKNETSI